MRRLTVFVALGLLLIGAVGMLYALGLQGIRAEEHRMREAALAKRARVLEQVVGQVAADLERLRTLETARPYDHFRHLYLPPNLVGNSLALLVSPLARETPEGVASYFEVRDGVLSSPAFPAELTVEDAPTEKAQSALPTLQVLAEHLQLLPAAQTSRFSAETTVEVDPLTCFSNSSNDLALAQIDEASRDPTVDAQLKGEWDAYRTRQGANPDQVDPASNFNGQQAYVPLNRRKPPAVNETVPVQLGRFTLIASEPQSDGWPELIVVARQVQIPGGGFAQTLGDPEPITWWQGLIVDLDWLRARSQSYLARAEEELETPPGEAALSLSSTSNSAELARPLPAPLGRLQVRDSQLLPAEAFLLARSRGVLHGALALALLVLGSGSWVLGRILTEEQALARRRSDFVAALTHELKAPLTGMRAMVELLHEGVITEPAQQQEYYGSLLQESERLSRLVRNVLDASQLERNVPLVTLARPLDLEPTLIAIAQSFATRLEAAGFELAIEIDDDLPQVQADPDALHQIVGNLIDNAAKYGGGAEQRVELSARSGAEGVEVRVRDWGPGIPSGEQRTVFERFVRGEGSPKEVGGAGLGLAIARAQATSLAAHLALEPADVGACFCLILPLAPTAA